MSTGTPDRFIAALNAALGERYRVEEELGRGATARVVRAMDLRNRRPVAIKVLHPELAQSLVAARFLREIEIAGGLTHPNILAVHDSGEADGMLYLVMPFVDGASLRDRLRAEGRLPLADALRLATQIADALGYAHSRGVVHRDIKPDNILLVAGHAVVTDFGVARALSGATNDRLTSDGSSVGSPAYMSPEQVFGDVEVDARSDLYSLGCVLHEMLAGAPPFTGESAQQVIMKRLSQAPPRIRSVVDSVPAHVEQAIVTALARDPAQRFQSAAALIAALARQTVDRGGARAIAVLPFANMSADPENEFFADGVTEDVIAQLAKLKSLKVISRTSVMPFKGVTLPVREIAAKLDVDTILEGSVRRLGDRVRIVAQLIDASTDEHLWASTYDRRLTDVFAIQSEVALAIAEALKAEMSAGDRDRIRHAPTSDVRAYELFLIGRQQIRLWTYESMRQGIALLEQAIARDPGFALAHATMAFPLLELAESGEADAAEGLRRAQAAAERALAIDEKVAEAHAARAHVASMRDFEWEAAERGYLRALELSPNDADILNWYGRLLAKLGRHDEALAYQVRAAELDPLSQKSDVATTYIRAGHFDAAIKHLMKVTRDDPADARARATLGWAHFFKGDRARGIEELELAASLDPHGTMWLAQLGQAYGLVGRMKEARGILQRLEERAQREHISPYRLAYVHAGLGEYDQAMDLLEQSFEQRGGPITSIAHSFLFVPLREHPRFKALLAKMRLT